MAGKIDLTIDKGATYRKTFFWKDSAGVPIDLTGYTARMQIRENYSSNTLIAELTTENGGITITPLEGKIELFLSDTDTTALTQSKGVYDIELLAPGGDVIKFLRGYVSILQEVTK